MYVCMYHTARDVLVMVCATAEVTPNTSPRLVYVFHVAMVQYSYYCLLVSGGLGLLCELTTSAEKLPI